MDDFKTAKYQLAEWRVSIYGKNINEWQKLAKWFYDNRLTCTNIRWLIQIPRLFHIYRSNNDISSFAEMLYNIFIPLFEASADPASYPEIHYFLETVVAFDSVDDESRPEHGRLTDNDICKPEDWTMKENPPYGYWMYYMYSNILALNKFRAARKLCTFAFRPHCGEAGDLDHLVSTFLVADQINHGILLRKNTGLHYLYYLAQIGIAISPLSNNKLFLDFHKNPFIKYFRQGMNVSLSTDDPLMLHYTKDPLLEEYSVATQVWKLSSTDQCEIARNSVLQSGWEAKYKKHYLGLNFDDPRETNVCKIRLVYRKETMESELDAMHKYATESFRPSASPRGMIVDQHPFATLPPTANGKAPIQLMPANGSGIVPQHVHPVVSAPVPAAAPATSFLVMPNLANLQIGKDSGVSSNASAGSVLSVPSTARVVASSDGTIAHAPLASEVQVVNDAAAGHISAAV
jgi:AMP deaminase